MRGLSKWVLESRQASEELSAEGNFSLMPDWAQSTLCGCLEKGNLADFVLSLILTKYLLCITCSLTSLFNFSRPGFEQFGAICVPFAWTQAIPSQQGYSRFSTWLHRALTYAIEAKILLNNTFTATICEPLLHIISYTSLQTLAHKYM